METPYRPAAPFHSRVAESLHRGWSLLLIRGIAAILFGIFTWARPAASLAAIIIVFGIYAIVDGILAISTAISARKRDEDWWVLLIVGLIGIAVGIITFATPGVTAFALLFYIALWAIARGVFEIVAGVRLRKVIEGEWVLILVGIASILFGGLLLARPGAGVLTVLWLIGIYAIVLGVLLVVLAFKARSFGKRLAAV